MKRTVLTIVLCLTLMPLAAQKGLPVEELFDGSYRKKTNAVEVVVMGKELAPYHLTLFRSLTVTDAPEEFKRIEMLVRQTGADALDKEEGSYAGKLYYGFYCLPAQGTRNRYLFYRNASLKKEEEKNEVTVVYMEGYATLEELKGMFR